MYFKKQPPEVFYICSWKFRIIHKKTPVLEPLFNKVAGAQAYKFIKKRRQHMCFSANIAKFLRTSILKNICERLLLNNGTIETCKSLQTKKRTDDNWSLCKRNRSNWSLCKRNRSFYAKLLKISNFWTFEEKSQIRIR